jgi:hypothetical protein
MQQISPVPIPEHLVLAWAQFHSDWCEWDVSVGGYPTSWRLGWGMGVPRYGELREQHSMKGVVPP